jgi:hypothetical protein
MMNLLQTDIDISNCLLNCSNNGICNLTSDEKFVCVCSEHFSGPKCDKNMRLCSRIQCLDPNSQCIDIINGTEYGFVCNCSFPNFGLRCENKIDLCKEKTCSNQGLCQVNLTMPVCKCFKGYSGELIYFNFKTIIIFL